MDIKEIRTRHETTRVSLRDISDLINRVEQLEMVVEDCRETIEYIRNYVDGRGLSAERDCQISLKLIKEVQEK